MPSGNGATLTPDPVTPTGGWRTGRSTPSSTSPTTNNYAPELAEPLATIIRDSTSADDDDTDAEHERWG